VKLLGFMFIFGGLALGCVHANATKIETEDSSDERYRIECNASADPEKANDCDYTADDICPNGYTTLGTNNRPIGYSAAGKTFAPKGASWSVSNTEITTKVHRVLIVRCQHPAPEAPEAPKE